MNMTQILASMNTQYTQKEKKCEYLWGDKTHRCHEVFMTWNGLESLLEGEIICKILEILLKLKAVEVSLQICVPATLPSSQIYTFFLLHIDGTKKTIILVFAHL